MKISLLVMSLFFLVLTGCKKEKVVPNRTILTTLTSGNWIPLDGGSTYTASIAVPEIDSYFVGDSRIELLMPELVPPRGEYWLFRWDLEGPSNTFTSTDLPETAFNLQPWMTNKWSISLWGSPPAPLLELTGIVSSFESVVVPEPSGILYGGVACFVLMANWWRRKPSGGELPARRQEAHANH